MAEIDDPFQPQAPSQPPDETGRQNLLAQWGTWMDAPGNRAAMVQFGLNLMQPVAIGQTAGGHFGQAVGAAGEALGRGAEADLAERKVQATEDKTSANIENQIGRLNVAQSRLGLEGERVGVARDRLAVDREREAGRNRRFDVSDATKRELSGLTLETRREIAEMQQQGQMDRSMLSADARRELAGLSRDAQREMFDIRQGGVEDRFGRSQEQRQSEQADRQSRFSTTTQQRTTEEEGRNTRSQARETGRGLRDVFRSQRSDDSAFSREVNRQAVEIYKKANDILTPENDPVKVKYKGRSTGDIASELAADPQVRQRYQGVTGRPNLPPAVQPPKRPGAAPTEPLEPPAAPEDTPQPAGGDVNSEEAILAGARRAIQRNAPRAEVERLLRLRGIDPRKL